MIAVTVLSGLTILSLLYLLHRKDEQMDRERTSHREQISEMCQRIQAPEIATIPEVELDPQHIPEDDWAQMNEQRERLSA